MDNPPDMAAMPSPDDLRRIFQNSAETELDARSMRLSGAAQVEFDAAFDKAARDILSRAQRSSYPPSFLNSEIETANTSIKTMVELLQRQNDRSIGSFEIGQRELRAAKDVICPFWFFC